MLLQQNVHELYCDIAELKDRVTCEKDMRLSEMNDSLKFQDQSLVQRNELEAKMLNLNDNLKSSQVALKNLTTQTNTLTICKVGYVTQY